MSLRAPRTLLVKGAVRGKKRVDAVDGTFACPRVRVPTPAPQDGGVGGPWE